MRISLRKLVYYIAVSIDGFIAAPDGDGDVYPISEEFTAYAAAVYPETLPTHVRPMLGIENAANVHFDTVVMGRNTYEPALRIDDQFGLDEPDLATPNFEHRPAGRDDVPHPLNVRPVGEREHPIVPMPEGVQRRAVLIA